MILIFSPFVAREIERRLSLHMGRSAIGFVQFIEMLYSCMCKSILMYTGAPQ